MAKAAGEMAGRTVNRPRPAALTVWRIILMICAVIPALVNSLFFTIAGVVWGIITCVWVVLFLFFYLFYLPVRYRRLAFWLAEDKIVLRSGVFYDNLTAMPLENIQFVAIRSNPLSRAFGLCSLVITAPGGRMVLHGMNGPDAATLLEVLAHREEEEGL